MQLLAKYFINNKPYIVDYNTDVEEDADINIYTDTVTYIISPAQIWVCTLSHYPDLEMDISLKIYSKIREAVLNHRLDKALKIVYREIRRGNKT